MVDDVRRSRAKPAYDSRHRVTNRDPDGRYTIVKEIIADPHYPCLLQQTTLDGERAVLSRLRLYALCAPHLAGGGWGNNAYVVQIAGRTILTAEKQGTWLALGADVPFSRASCGYVGRSDGWTDLADNFQMSRTRIRTVAGWRSPIGRPARPGNSPRRISSMPGFSSSFDMVFASRTTR